MARNFKIESETFLISSLYNSADVAFGILDFSITVSITLGGSLPSSTSGEAFVVPSVSISPEHLDPAWSSQLLGEIW